MAEQDQDRTEQATPFRLEEARKKGNVPKSMDFTSWTVVTTAYVVLLFLGIGMMTQLAQLSSFFLSQAGNVDLSVTNVTALLHGTIDAGLGAAWPLWLALFVGGLAAILTNSGLVFSFFPLKPDMKRLNPVEGFKRVFSMKMLFEAVKTFLKLAIVIAVVGVLVFQAIEDRLVFHGMQIEQIVSGLIQEGGFLLLVLILSFIPVFLFDLIYSRYDYAKKMRMSHRDIKDENKRRDGDPEVKSKRRQLQRELAAQVSSLSNVSSADVVITNPTHIAVALRYDRATMVAPMVVAKGAGARAAVIRSIARRNGVLLIENKPLARSLFRSISINHPIAPDHFPGVAQAYNEVMKSGGVTL